MKTFLRSLGICLYIVLFTSTLVYAFGRDVLPANNKRPAGDKEAYIIFRVPVNSPLFSSFPVAVVNGEPVTLREFNELVASVHGDMPAERKAVKIDFSAILRRLINIRLALEEAKAMELDELPEIKAKAEMFSKQTLRSLLIDKITKGVKVDEAEVEKRYNAATKELNVKGIQFKTKEEAEKMEAAMRSGEAYDALAAKAVAEGTGKIFKEGEYLKWNDISPKYKEALTGMEVGASSPVITAPEGFVILKLLDIRVQEDPQVRERIRDTMLAEKKAEVVIENNKALSKKYVKVREKLFDSLNLEVPTPVFLKLLEDKRVLADIKGDKAVTVGEFTREVMDTFYHDVELAIKEKKVNKRKIDVLERIIYKRVVLLEALNEGIDKTDEYKIAMKEFRDSAVFGTFVNKVLAPEVKITEEDMKTYYDQHIAEYSSSGAMKIRSLVFSERNDAEMAIELLRKGSDFVWIKDNAENQLDPKGSEVIQLDGSEVRPDTLPEGMARAVTGSKAGDVLLYKSPEGYFYILSIEEVFPTTVMPYVGAREKIAEILYKERLEQQFSEWADKLRDAYDVKIFATDLMNEQVSSKTQKVNKSGSSIDNSSTD